MSVPDAVLAEVVAALPGAVLWEQGPAAPHADELLVFDAIVPPQPPRRYVAVYSDDGHRTPGAGRSNAAVSGQSTSDVYRWQVTCVAPDRHMTVWLSGRIRDHLVDRRLSVDGWDAGLIRHDGGQRARPDETVLERPVIYAVDLYAVDTECVPVES